MARSSDGTLFMQLMLLVVLCCLEEITVLRDDDTYVDDTRASTEAVASRTTSPTQFPPQSLPVIQAVGKVDTLRWKINLPDTLSDNCRFTFHIRPLAIGDTTCEAHRHPVVFGPNRTAYVDWLANTVHKPVLCNGTQEVAAIQWPKCTLGVCRLGIRNPGLEAMRNSEGLQIVCLFLAFIILSASAWAIVDHFCRRSEEDTTEAHLVDQLHDAEVSVACANTFYLNIGTTVALCTFLTWVQKVLARTPQHHDSLWILLVIIVAVQLNVQLIGMIVLSRKMLCIEVSRTFSGVLVLRDLSGASVIIFCLLLLAVCGTYLHLAYLGELAHVDLTKDENIEGGFMASCTEMVSHAMPSLVLSGGLISWIAYERSLMDYALTVRDHVFLYLKRDERQMFMITEEAFKAAETCYPDGLEVLIRSAQSTEAASATERQAANKSSAGKEIEDSQQYTSIYAGFKAALGHYEQHRIGIVSTYSSSATQNFDTLAHTDLSRFQSLSDFEYWPSSLLPPAQKRQLRRGGGILAASLLLAVFLFWLLFADIEARILDIKATHGCVVPDYQPGQLQYDLYVSDHVVEESIAVVPHRDTTSGVDLQYCSDIQHCSARSRFGESGSIASDWFWSIVPLTGDTNLVKVVAHGHRETSVEFNVKRVLTHSWFRLKTTDWERCIPAGKGSFPKVPGPLEVSLPDRFADGSLQVDILTISTANPNFAPEDCQVLFEKENRVHGAESDEDAEDDQLSDLDKWLSIGSAHLDRKKMAQRRIERGKNLYTGSLPSQRLTMLTFEGIDGDIYLNLPFSRVSFDHDINTDAIAFDWHVHVGTPGLNDLSISLGLEHKGILVQEIGSLPKFGYDRSLPRLPLCFVPAYDTRLIMNLQDTQTFSAKIYSDDLESVVRLPGSNGSSFSLIFKPEAKEANLKLTVEHKAEYSESIDALEQVVSVLKQLLYEREQISALKNLTYVPPKAKQLIESVLAHESKVGLAMSSFNTFSVIEMLEQIQDTVIAGHTAKTDCLDDDEGLSNAGNSAEHLDIGLVGNLRCSELAQYCRASSLLQKTVLAREYCPKTCGRCPMNTQPDEILERGIVVLKKLLNDGERASLPIQTSDLKNRAFASPEVQQVIEPLLVEKAEVLNTSEIPGIIQRLETVVDKYIAERTAPDKEEPLFAPRTQILTFGQPDVLEDCRQNFEMYLNNWHAEKQAKKTFQGIDFHSLYRWAPFPLDDVRKIWWLPPDLIYKTICCQDSLSMETNFDSNSSRAISGRAAASIITARVVTKALYLQGPQIISGPQDGLGNEGIEAMTGALAQNVTIPILSLTRNGVSGSAGGRAVASLLNAQTVTQSLYLGENLLGNAGIEAMSKELAPHATIPRLGLHRNDVNGAAGGKPVAALLNKRFVTEELDLQHNELGNEGIEAMAAALAPNATIPTLILEDTGVSGAAGGKAVAALLNVQIATEGVDLKKNCIGNEGIEAMIEAVSLNVSIPILELDQTGVNGAAGGRAVAALISTQIVTQRLNLSNNSLGNEGVDGMAAALAPNATIPSLKLTNNGVNGSAGGKAVAALLNARAVTEFLHFRDNALGNEGIEAMSEELAPNATIPRLGLHRNGVNGAAGGKAIAALLNARIATEELNLWRNDLGNEGMGAMSEALVHNATIPRLKLENIGVHGAAGGRAVAALLNARTVTEELNLRDNILGYEGIEAMTEALSSNAAIPRLKLTKDRMDLAAGGKALAVLLNARIVTEEVGIDCAGFDNEGIQAMTEAPTPNATIPKLKLGRLCVKGAAGGKAVAALLNARIVTEELNLWRNQFGVEGIEAMAESLAPNTTIPRLELGEAGVKGATGGKAVAALLNARTVTEALDLQSNELRDEGIYVMAGALAPIASIPSITLRDNCLNSIAGGGAVAALLNTRAVTEELDLKHNRIGNAGIRAMTEALAPTATIPSIKLSANGLKGAAGGKAVASLLNARLVTQQLDLWGNELGSEGIVAMTETLAPTTTIPRFKLGRNGVNGVAGGRALALLINARIITEELDIGGNELGNEDINAMIEAFAPNATIPKLNLSLNAVYGAAGGSTIAALLNAGIVTEELSLKWNRLGKDGIEALTEALAPNVTIPRLNLDKYGLTTPTGDKTIDAVLRPPIATEHVDF